MDKEEKEAHVRRDRFLLFIDLNIVFFLNKLPIPIPEGWDVLDILKVPDVHYVTHAILIKRKRDSPPKDFLAESAIAQTEAAMKEILSLGLVDGYLVSPETSLPKNRDDIPFGCCFARFESDEEFL